MLGSRIAGGRGGVAKDAGRRSVNRGKLEGVFRGWQRFRQTCVKIHRTLVPQPAEIKPLGIPGLAPGNR